MSVKAAEAALVRARELGRVFVGLARHFAAQRHVADGHRWLYQRQQRSLDATFVHVVERHLHRPLGVALTHLL